MHEFESRKPLEYYELSLDNGCMFHESPSLQGAPLTEGRNVKDQPRFTNLSPSQREAGSFGVLHIQGQSGPGRTERWGGGRGAGGKERTVGEVSEDEVAYNLGRDEARRDPRCNHSSRHLKALAPQRGVAGTWVLERL